MAQVTDWVMASVTGNLERSPYQFAVSSDAAPYGIKTGTHVRDVSEMLDLLALTETPFINRIGWGAESGGLSIEWITEDLGPGWIENISAVASGAAGSIILNSIDGVTGSDLVRQLHNGTILYVYSSEDVRHGVAVVCSEPAIATTACSIVVSFLHLDTYASGLTTINADTKFYILGNVQNEGSKPGDAHPRDRVLASNNFSILRQDVAITGTMAKTDMYAVGNEANHQILMRMKEMQRDRERLALFAIRQDKTSTTAGIMNGVFGFLTTQSGTHIDRATKSLTETSVNNVVSYIWEKGGRNLTAFGSINQTAKFTRWDKNRIRTRVNDRRGGGYITSYMTESGIELDLVPMPNVPRNFLFILDPERIKLRPKRGRKAIMEKLGKSGDFDDWQLISEFTLEFKGYNLGQHGMFTVLT